MIVYSERIVHFISQIKKHIRSILSREMGLKVQKSRFLDVSETMSYPIKIVIFNQKGMLGYFHSDFLELGFHERLMYEKTETLINLIRHELAHYMTYISYGDKVQSHGPEFREICQKYGWGKEVSLSSICLDGKGDDEIQEESRVFKKVKKLMALGSSSSQNEAEAAVLKSQELLLKYNLEPKNLEEEERFYLKRILKKKKESAKMRAIAQILETFFVHIVLHRSKGFVSLEIVGEKVNLEIAEYVANVLEEELERLWKNVKKEAKITSLTSRNSFFLGVSKGYCEKVGALKKAHGKMALMVIENKLSLAKEMAYSSLSYRRSKTKCCEASLKLGEKAGKGLTIQSGIGRDISSVLLIS